MKSRVCELCNREASLYCVSDSAFLCWDCDASVHEANFLVARHVRRTICCKCKEFDGNHVSGVGIRSCQPICRSCASDSDEITSDSESSCISSTCTSSSKKLKSDRISGKTSTFFPTKVSSKKNRNIVNVDVKAEAILVNWLRKLGLKSNNSTISFALHAFSICLRKFTSVPFRVSLATSLWFSLKVNGEIVESTCQYLKRFGVISGVPAKLIAVSEKKISGVLKIKSKSEVVVVDLEEGWAECSE